MGHIIIAFYKGFGQLSDSSTRSVIFRSIGWSVIIFMGLYVALFVALKVTSLFALGWLDSLFDFISQFGLIVVTWYLFPAVVTAVGALMLDGVVDAVEHRHYPTKTVARGQSFWESLGPALKFLGSTVGYNLLILPLFLFPPLWAFIPFVYLALNGYLISREFFELVALRRISGEDAAGLRTKWKWPLFVAGIGFAIMLTVPVLNLIAPVIATATMVHLFEYWRTKSNIKDKPIHHKIPQNTVIKAKGKDPSDSLGNDLGDDDVITLSGPQTDKDN